MKLKNWKETLLVAQAAVIVVGYNVWPEPKECDVKAEVVEKIVYKDKIVYVDRVVVKDRTITKPDGTKIEETTRTEEKKKQDESSTTDENKTEIEVASAPQPAIHASLGIDPLAYLRDQEYVAILGGGLRLGNTPFFLTVNPTINLSKPGIKNVFLGLTLEID